MEIKNFSDFEPFKNASNIFNISILGLGTILGLLGCYYSVRVLDVELIGWESVPGWMMHTLLILALISVFPVFMLGDCIDRAKGKGYRKWLSAKNKEELILIFNSPEFGGRENKAARDLLNKKYPGWSLEQLPPKHYVEDV